MRTRWSRGLYQLLMSSVFTLFLEALTGVQGLVADTHFFGSGFDQTLPGGALAVHTDFHYNPQIKLTRRVNVFLYLNHEWREEYGGALELWSATPQSLATAKPKPFRLEKAVAPLWNRMFIFATGDRTFHGHPMPLNTTSRTRRSIAMYYHANGAVKSELHLGESYAREQPAETTLECSGIPPHHHGTKWPPCESFDAVGARRPGMNCGSNARSLRAGLAAHLGDGELAGW